ncbi:hypothetical protein [Capnocytophaga gingivalis]|jgi:hypothetical protein|uniref:Tetratricopeptide repeat protein n=1 Tax=Capnocytophaga gingivalis TaxID=1017 RepID=A0ABU5Z8V8_9FLAO|nr:hypothetical protein [Capnocytophaga gingivalis]MEB3075410.1 hypothetical protein [Capnocytophaga gingivalis]
MTATDLSLILKQPNHITLSQVYELENIIHEYPYFQVVKAIYLKILYAQESYRYNKELKITAAHIGNRTLLFDFITSTGFKDKKNVLKKEEMPKAYVDEAIPSEFTTYVSGDVFEKKEFYPVTHTVEQSQTSKDAISSSEQQQKEALHMGKPIDFQPNDKQSFATWLQVTRYKPIDRRTTKTATTIDLPFVDKNIFEEGDVRAKKFDLIDKFLEANPKIEVNKDYDDTSSNIEIVEKKDIGRQFMTETLAKVYLEQGKYTEAIQAYQILMLKNPAKSAYFAEQISIIRKLQQNK